jgi:hypothetical protein
MSVENPITVERPRKLPMELRKEESALNLDIIDLPVRDRFLIVSSVLAQRERKDGLHWHQYEVSWFGDQTLPEEISETLGMLGLSEKYYHGLRVCSRVQLLDKKCHSKNEIAVGFEDQEGKILVYKFDNNDNFLTRRRRKTPASRMTFDYRYAGVRERENYREGYMLERAKLKAYGVFDDVEGAFSRLAHFLNFCRLYSPIYEPRPII